jgi:hypothetical protein
LICTTPPTSKRRPHVDHQALEVRRQLRPAQAGDKPDAAGGIHRPQQLRDAGDGGGPGQRGAHVPAHAVRQKHRGDEDKVHQHRHRPGLGEMAVGVQDAGEQGKERDEADVAEGDPPEVHRHVEAPVADEARRHRPDEKRHGKRADQRKDGQEAGQAGKGVLRESLGILAASSFLA